MAEPFYAEGLCFSCQRCSGCCGGGPGFVFLTDGDLSRLLSALDLSFQVFFRRYCRLVDTGTGRCLSLVERPNYDCIFWEDGCLIYEHRPLQCSAYPFWSSIMGSRQAWVEEAAHCPGIDRGELRSRAYIEQRLYQRRAARTIVFDYGQDPETMDADTILGR